MVDQSTQLIPDQIVKFQIQDGQIHQVQRNILKISSESGTKPKYLFLRKCRYYTGDCYSAEMKHSNKQSEHRKVWQFNKSTIVRRI